METMVMELQAHYPSCIMLFQFGDFLYAFGEDADTINYVCDIYTSENGSLGSTTGFSYLIAPKVIGQLLGAGLQVAIASRNTTSLN